jgi:hypothetical protein
MSKLEIEFWDFRDTRGQQQIISGCPTRHCEKLHYLFQRLNEELAKSSVPFEAEYAESVFLRSLCENIMELCGVDHRYVSPLMVRALVVNPAHLYLINFVSSEEGVPDEVEKLTLAQSNAQLEAALVASGLVPSLVEAKALTSSYSFDSLKAIVDAHVDMTNPDSPGNKERARKERQAQLEADAEVLSQFVQQNNLG